MRESEKDRMRERGGEREREGVHRTGRAVSTLGGQHAAVGWRFLQQVIPDL